jgi:hypothetical protein
MCNVYVEKKKALMIDENYVTILPNEIRDIGYTVEPAGSEVKVNTDFNEYVEIMPGYPKDGILKIKGKEREGFTQITLSSNYIEKMITVNTNYNYTFYLEGKAEADGSLSGITAVRGQPGQTLTLVYGIHPKQDQVRFIEGTGYYYQRRIASPVSIDKDNHRLTIRLDNCGYSVMEYESDYNKNIGLNLEIPVYVYYPRIDLKCQEDTDRNIKTHSGNYKSRIDALKNAVYIADNETLAISYARLGNFPAGYPGADLVISEETDDNVGSLLVGTGSQRVTITGETFTPLVSGSGGDSLVSVEYAGLLKIVYTHSTGGETPGSFSKTFMVYKEKWARK